jgi:hypothetical protein
MRRRGSNWRDALQHSRFGHIFPISFSKAAWLMVRPPECL